jgi:hypothetical protein
MGDEIDAGVFVAQPGELTLVAADRHDAIAGRRGLPQDALADGTAGTEHHDRRPDCPMGGMFTPAHGTVTGIWPGPGAKRLNIRNIHLTRCHLRLV